VRERLQLGFRRPCLLPKEAEGGREVAKSRVKKRFRGVGYDDVAAPEKAGASLLESDLYRSLTI
jgi:hypothetical protein